MSQYIYDSYSAHLIYVVDEMPRLYKMNVRSFQKWFEISWLAAKSIHTVMHSSTFSQEPRVIASLLAYATYIDNWKFWRNFKCTIEYIFIEFALRNFFPLAYGVDVNKLRKEFVTIMANTRDYQAVLRVVNPQASLKERYFEYVAGRSRGESEHLANLIIASLALPANVFDWNSCFRGDETEYLMMFGLKEMNPKMFRTFCYYALMPIEL
jgi:hypothetical protein